MVSLQVQNLAGRKADFGRVKRFVCVCIENVWWFKHS
jgi:hypothetical protein